MDKLRYMISDAAGLVNVEAHVLRYWEEELELDIPRNEMGHRYYTKENIQQFLKIKDLNQPANFSSAEDKMAQFRILMSGIVKEALSENNQALGKEVGESVGDRVLKEMNYLMREQDEQEEERFRKLDAAIRELNAKKIKGSAKKKESHRLFAKKEVTT